MLPKELLAVKRWGSRIAPKYAKPRLYRPLAEKILEIFKEEIGKSKEVLLDTLEELEDWRNYKLIRGLTELLVRQCTFEEVDKVPPEKVRRELFNRGFVTSQNERNNVIKDVARDLGISSEDVEQAFFADLDKNKILKSPSQLSATELLQKYNFSLTQTLLFNANNLQFEVSGNYQEIFRRIKFLGLMYDVEGQQEALRTKVTGPASLFRKTRKYGTKLAKLLPAILKARTWKLHAEIEQKVRGEPRIYIFKLDSSKGELLGVEPMEEVKFDSLIEEDFAKKLQGIAKDWQIKREPELLVAGNKVIIPDFVIEKGDTNLFVEIVGFWTKDYLDSKLEKLEDLERNILLFVNEKLNCTKADFKQQREDVIFYRRKISAEDVLPRIRKIEESTKKKELKQLNSGDITLKDGVTVEELAGEMGISPSVAKEMLKKKVETSEQYHLISGRVTHQTTLDELKRQITELSDMSLKNVTETLQNAGFDIEVLRKLGYTVEWRGLDPEKANVKERRV